MANDKNFILHGKSGVLTLRIEHEQECHDGLMLICGIVLEGVEHYCGDDGTYHGSQDIKGKVVSAWVTKADLARGTDAPIVEPRDRRDRH